MITYEELYQHQLKLNSELREEIKKVTTLNEKLKGEVRHITSHVDEEVVKKMNLTKDRINEMIMLIDGAIETERKSLPGYQRRRLLHR